MYCVMKKRDLSVIKERNLKYKFSFSVENCKNWTVRYCGLFIYLLPPCVTGMGREYNTVLSDQAIRTEIVSLFSKS